MTEPAPSDSFPDELGELLAEVRRIEAQSNRLVSGVMAGGYSSVFRGSGIEFDELREYAWGDDPRSVDWNVTARVGRPFVKEFVEERERTLMFVLDLSASMSGGFGPWSARQMAARVCACLALSATRNDDRVGLVAFSGGVDRFVPPRKGLRHVLRIVRDCLALRGSAPRTELAPALEFVSRALRRRAIVFVVSDFLDVGGGAWRDALALCSRRHDVIAARLSVPELDLDTVPAEAGLVRVRDPETGRAVVVDWADAATRADFAERAARQRGAVARDLRAAGVDVMEVPVPREPDRDAVARPILAFFRTRERRSLHR